jgi:epoxide hydrolase 4
MLSCTSLIAATTEMITDFSGQKTQVTHQTETLKNVKLHVVTAGPIDGEPVILLHGYPDFWYGWKNQIVALAKAGYQVIAPDMRGYNKSEKPKHIKDYNIDKVVADILELSEKLHPGEKVNLVGHDWGAIISWYTVYKKPAKFKRLFIFNVPHPGQINEVFTKPFLYKKQVFSMSWYIWFFHIPILPEFIGKRLLGYEKSFKQVFTSTMVHKEMITDADKDRYIKAWRQKSAARSSINYYRANFIKMIRQAPPVWNFKLPVFFTFGMQDSALQAELYVETIGKYVPGVHVYKIPDSSHFVQLDTPKKVNDILLKGLLY